MRYFISDTHFGHAGHSPHTGIINFERFQFDTIQEHDEFVRALMLEWAEKLKPEDEFYHLGDWGNVDELWIMGQFKCKTIFVYGNHDSLSDQELFKKWFDEVHLYPIYLSNKLVISHIPVAVWPDTINVHGHLHGSTLNSENYICASLHVVDYKLVPEKKINNVFSKLPKYSRHFLEEPYADMMKFMWEREDIVSNKDGLIDLAATKALWKLKGKKSQRDGK